VSTGTKEKHKIIISYQINHDVLTVIEGIQKEREVKQEVLYIEEVRLF
jgi:hypothetical protein